jgi:hypothetical protein
MDEYLDEWKKLAIKFQDVMKKTGDLEGGADGGGGGRKLDCGPGLSALFVK